MGELNEGLCKVLCHNLCVIIQAIHELGIDPTFDTKTSLIINPILYGKWENLEMLDISGDYFCIEMDSKGRNEDVFISWHSILALRHSPQPRGFIPYGFCALMV